MDTWRRRALARPDRLLGQAWSRDRQQGASRLRVPRRRARLPSSRAPYVPQPGLCVLQGARLGRGGGVGLEARARIRSDAPRSMKRGGTVSAMRDARRLALAALAIPIVVSMLTGYAGASATVQVISTDPLTSSTGQHQTEVEPDTFAVGATILSAFQVGRIYNGGAAAVGWATATDGRPNWSHRLLPGLTQAAEPSPGPYSRG